MTLLCPNCRWLLGSHPDGGMICAAFEGPIPYAITSGHHDHRLPFEGDHGVRYEAIHPLDLDPPRAAQGAPMLEQAPLSD